MKKYISSIFWLILFGVFAYYAYSSFDLISVKIGLKQAAEVYTYIFAAGFALAAVIYNLLYNMTTTSLNMYKRELEKESIGKTENKSRVKVLESKIEVLEKALEEALKK